MNLYEKREIIGLSLFFLEIKSFLWYDRRKMRTNKYEKVWIRRWIKGRRYCLLLARERITERSSLSCRGWRGCRTDMRCLSMFPKVVQVVPMKDYTVYVYFEDGKIVCYDMKKMFSRKSWNYFISI